MSPRRILVTVLVVFITGLLSTGYVWSINQKTGSEQPDARFLDANKQIVSLFWKNTADIANVNRCIVARLGKTEIGSYVIAARWFGRACIIEGPRGHGQMVLLPYLGASGTGYASESCLLISVIGSSVRFNDIGLWHYHSVSRESFISDLCPYLTKEGGPGELILQFRHKEKTEKDSSIIDLLVQLDLVDAISGNVCYVPYTRHDADQCVQLLRSESEPVVQWAKKCLGNIVAAHMAEFDMGSVTDGDERMVELSKALDQHYKRNTR